MNKSTVAFIVLLFLGAAVAVFAPFLVPLTSYYGSGVPVFITMYTAIALLAELGVAAGWNIRRFFFAPAVPPVLLLIVYLMMNGWVDLVCGVVAAVAFAETCIFMGATALIRYLVKRNKRPNE